MFTSQCKTEVADLHSEWWCWVIADQQPSQAATVLSVAVRQESEVKIGREGLEKGQGLWRECLGYGRVLGAKSVQGVWRARRECRGVPAGCSALDTANMLKKHQV